MDLSSAKVLMQSAVTHLDQEFRRMQVGRANTAMVEGMLVEAYGSTQPLRNVATLTTPDARTIMIQPWDKAILGNVEKSIRERKELGFNPTNDGHVVRINIPQPTEERRKELAKVTKEYLEQCRVSIRNARHKTHEQIKQEEKDKKISEDQRMRLEKELQALVDQFNKLAEDAAKMKEKEIMTI